MKSIKIFCTTCFLSFMLNGCGTQEAAPIEYGGNPNGQKHEKSQMDPIFGNDDSEKISSKSFEISSEDDSTVEQGHILRDKDHEEKQAKKYINEETEEVKTVEIKKTKIENEDLDSELNSIELENEPKNEPKNEIIEASKKPEAVLVKKEEIIQENPKQLENLKNLQQETIASVIPSISLMMPVQGKITAKFGDLVDGIKNSGINIEAPLNTSITAAASGTIVHVGNDGKFGKLVIIRHDPGNLQTAYAHLNSVAVSKGQVVTAGEEIGTLGQTGGVNKPMLHFAVREGKNPVDPMKFLK